MRVPIRVMCILVGAVIACGSIGCAGPRPGCVLRPQDHLDRFGDLTDTRLQALAFMRGSWAAGDTDGRSEEIWSGASGSCIMGAFRMVKPDGSLAFYEILSISAEPDGVFMRLRHFDAKLTAREEKDAPVALKLETIEKSRAVFRKISGSVSLDTITYERTGDVLNSEVAFTPESKRTTLRFEMHRLTDR